MNYFFLFICLGIFGVGDILGVLTKAKVSAVFVALMLFLVGFMTGIIPADIIKQAGLTEVASWATAFIVFHMGTMINWKELIQQWRVVIMSMIGMVVAVVAIFAVSPIIGIRSALMSIPIVNGGIVATQIMVAGAMAKGFSLIAALGAMVYAVQKFVGTPPASLHGLKEARKILAEYRAKKASGQLETEKEVPSRTEKQPSRVMFYQKYEKYFTDYTCIAIVGLFAWLSTVLGKVTPISYSVWALLLGATVGYMGLVPPKILEKGRSSGFLSMAIFASIIPSLATVKLADLGTLGLQLIVVFGAVMVAIYIFIYVLPLWKVVGSKDLAVGIAVTQMLGFPATYLIANEIATAVAETPDEKEAVLKVVMPAYVVAGLVSVTTLSIIIAGIFVKFL
jgi:MFS family permease